MADDFWERYKHPKWQERRLRIMERDGFACVVCGDKNATLNVHHGYYQKGNNPWDYPDESLRTLCEPCHKDVQQYLSLIRTEVGLFHPEKLAELLGLIKLVRDQTSETAKTNIHGAMGWLYGITQREEWVAAHRAYDSRSGG